MNKTDDEAPPENCGYITPPLSPSKTVSTDGWSPPRTPGSPRKPRGCPVFRDIGTDPFLLSPSDSPSKQHSAPRLCALRLSDFSAPKSGLASPSHDDDSPVKRDSREFDGSLLRRSASFALSDGRSSPGVDVPVTKISNSHSGNSLAFDHSKYASPRVGTSNDCDCLGGSLAGRSPSPSPSAVPLFDTDIDTLGIPSRTNTFHSSHSPITRDRVAVRHSSSPLRPSQWVTRGGLLSLPRIQTRTPDRFISSRRPLYCTRDSFELNKPQERITAERRIVRGGAAKADPFSRRLRRSVRLNDELRSLQETHSVIVGRASFSRRIANLGIRRSSVPSGPRQISAGAVWNVGGSSAVGDTVIAVSNGRGGMLGSRTNAPLYKSQFLNRQDPDAELEAYEQRLALALDVDQTHRILEHSALPSSPLATRSDNKISHLNRITHVWRDSKWISDGVITLLDAPQLRDDYYCSLLAYSQTAKCLAVGLGSFVHLWSERTGVDTPESLNSLSQTTSTDVQHVTSLAFSSAEGGQAVLAVGRADGRIALWSPFDSEPRFDATQPKPISCVSFRPTLVKRPSVRDKAMDVPTEELLIGDEAGHIYFYSVEWPSETESALFGWHGAMTLLARMTIHTQQICGLSWSADGDMFASGGNDNSCYLFETRRVLDSHSASATEPSTTLDVRYGPNGESIYTVTPGRGPVLSISADQCKQRWELHAAVKAIAFCPWQRGLLAIGGGSNDRCIHFYHTISGACLATIDCAAQVTSLTWSHTRREIAATFGFAQPEHPYRVAVFAWPSCEQMVAVPWYDESRALFAVAYPGGPDKGTEAAERARGEDGVWWKGGPEGSLVVASSDSAIRFHEIWAEGKKDIGLRAGLLGGSDILEGLHGIEKDGERMIR